MSHSQKKPNKQQQSRDIETTLSAKNNIKSNAIKSSKPKVSEFLPVEAQDAKNNQELEKVKQINYKYIELYQSLFERNKKLLNLFDGNVYELYDSKQKLAKQQKSQFECMKILQNTQRNIIKMQQIRHANEDWLKIEQYLKNSKGNQIEEASKLVNRYKQISKRLKEAERQHEELLSRKQGNNKVLQEKQENLLSQSERELKYNTRKLKKLLEEQKRYQKNCKAEQTELQNLIQLSRNIQQNKLAIEMKIVSESAKNERLVRKIAKRKQKSS